MKKQYGFAHAFLIVGLVVALIGALGFIFWQNFINKEPAKTETVTITKPAKDDSEVKVDSNKGYLVLKDWEVRFKESSQPVEYRSKENGTYLFTTSKWKSLADACMNKGVELGRSTTEQSKGTEQVPLNDGEKVGDYYYYQQSSLGTCSDDYATEKEQHDLVSSFLDSIEEAR